MKILIVMPTYNEKENISEIIPEIFSKTKGLNLNILVVDDASPDGTGAIVKKMLKNKYKNKLFIIERKGKLGLASAYIAGFEWGQSRKYDVFIEMDADFSHNPKYLMPMIKNLNNYDVIIGSRNIKGGGVRGWGLVRNLISKGGSLYSQAVLGCPVKDLTGGFNMWKKEVLKKINLSSIISKGYSFQIEMKYKAFKNKVKILEYPIIFEDRTRGKSKMSKKIFIEALLNIWKIRGTN